ncbi:MAG: PilZ domain-containing protein [Planctomycetes bacterium]|nr:PilZ domain-containing protein [Planctomycetota bacterium]
MSEIVMLQGPESQTVLQMVVQTQAPAIMSYLSKDKWHVAKVVMKDLRADRLYVENCHTAGKPHPINIRLEQPVGVNFKHAYGKFVFDTTVVGFEPSADPEAGGTIVLAAPQCVGVVQRRSYFRVNVPASLRVNVVLWHRTGHRASDDRLHAYCEGRLVDISAGGAQVVVPLKHGAAGGPAGLDTNSASPASNAASAGALQQTVMGAAQAPPAGAAPRADAPGTADFRKGQFLGVRFTPMPYEVPLMFNAQIRNVLPTADHAGLCLGLQIVGLEASEDGRQTLSRLAQVVERYHQINQAQGQIPQTTVQAGSTTFHVPCEAQ